MFLPEKAPGEIPFRREQHEESKITKLSQAIREGAKLLPQGSKVYFADGRTCAIGAAFHAINGYPSGNMDCVEFCGRWVGPRLQTAGIFTTDIFERNDRGWTREAIADWLEERGL